MSVPRQEVANLESALFQGLIPFLRKRWDFSGFLGCVFFKGFAGFPLVV